MGAEVAFVLGILPLFHGIAHIRQRLGKLIILHAFAASVYSLYGYYLSFAHILPPASF